MSIEMPLAGGDPGPEGPSRREAARHLAVLLRALADWQALQIRRAERLAEGARALEEAAIRRHGGGAR